MILRHNR